MSPSKYLLMTAVMSLALVAACGCTSADNPLPSSRLTQPEPRSLDQDYPNPFKPDTAIVYSVTETTHVRIEISSVLGNVIATLVDEIQAPGEYVIAVVDIELENGIYFAKIVIGSESVTRRLYILKS